jgi:ABC-type lipoprotein release transport system permease subunit
MIWKIAWKNIWRNPVRSFVVIGSVMVGVFAGVFMIAFMNGMITQRVDAALNEEISHIWVTGKGFNLNNDPQITIPDISQTLSAIKGVEGISGLVKRTVISGMAGTASKSAGVQIVGIDPEEDKKIFSIYETIIGGTGGFFMKESKFNLALIGQDLAKELNIIRFSIDSSALSKLAKEGIPESVLKKVSQLSATRFPNEKKFDKKLNETLLTKELSLYGRKIKDAAWSFREGSKLTLTFLDKDNNQVGAVFRLTGIFDTKNMFFELGTVFVKDSDLKRLTGMSENSFHQVIIRINDIEQTARITDVLRNKLPGLDVTNWKELQPDIAMMTDYVQEIYGFFMFIILAALAFGIVNTMLMVVLERTRELGMLTAIGMNRKKVFSMIMLESVFLSLFGGGAGMAVGWISVILTARHGINFTQYAEGLEAFGYSAHIYPEIGAGFFVMITIMIIITGILSSIYPALKALKLNPIEAIRTE